jgi:hypothetical protein
MFTDGVFNPKTNPKAQAIIAIIEIPNFKLANLVIIMNYLVGKRIMPTLFHEARPQLWLCTWLLYPYVPYIKYFWNCRVFKFQQEPGETVADPPIPLFAIDRPPIQFPFLPGAAPLAAPAAQIEHEDNDWEANLFSEPGMGSQELHFWDFD